jgi:hypothetical protein
MRLAETVRRSPSVRRAEDAGFDDNFISAVYIATD